MSVPKDACGIIAPIVFITSNEFHARKHMAVNQTTRSQLG